MYSSVLLFLNIGGGEMIFISFVALLLFGGDKLPEIARGLGKGIREFKDASENVKREITNQINNYEERRTEEPVTPPVVETPKELPAAEEHAALSGHETEAHESDVPNTMAYNENFAHAANSNLHDTPNETPNTVEEIKTETVKTHE